MAGDLPPGRWSALLVGAWWPARPDAPMAGVTYWRKAAQLKRNEANDLRNERSLLAVTKGAPPTICWSDIGAANSD